MAKDITPRKRSKVIALKENTEMTVRDISMATGLSRSSVSRLILAHKRLGTVSPRRKGKCGRKRKTTVRDDMMLLRNSKKDPRKTSCDLQRDLLAAGIEVTSSTVRRRLLSVGRRARKPINKQLLTSAMKKKRLLWAKEHVKWDVDNWKKVLFSDETHFVVHGFNSAFVRRSPGEPISPAHINQTTKHPPKKMFWGSFTANGLGGLITVDGMMNSEKYIEVLRRKVIPDLANYYPAGDGVFQQDLAPCHSSKKTKTFMEDNNILTLSWPGNSPDLNPIENLWSIIKSRLRKRDCSTLRKLIEAVIQIWHHDEELKKMCSTLVESMPKRVKEIIAAKGGLIHY